MKITHTEEIDPDVNRAVTNGLIEHNHQFAPRDYKDFQISIRDDNKIIAGASGSSYWNWVFVKFLWVDSNSRGKGVGTVIMSEIEKLALARECIGIHLDTFSFQAHDFYKKNGYVVFGVIDNHPIGHKRFFMLKKLK